MWGTLRGTTVNHQCNIVCALLHQRNQNPIFYCEDFLCFFKGKKTKANQEKKKSIKNCICCRNKACSTFHSFFFSKRECHCSLVFQYVPAELSKGSTEVKDATVVSRICTFVPKRIDQNQRVSYNLPLSQH